VHRKTTASPGRAGGFNGNDAPPQAAGWFDWARL